MQQLRTHCCWQVGTRSLSRVRPSSGIFSIKSPKLLIVSGIFLQRKLIEKTKIDFVYPTGVASIKVAQGAKSEGDLIVTGTRGYIYVPAPWWKTDYFEIRYENQEENKRFFYQLDGEGIRYEIVAFIKSIESGRNISYISNEQSTAIVGVIQDFNSRLKLVKLN